MSWRQFIAWTRFHRIRSIDETDDLKRLLALQTIYLARAAGDENLQMEDVLPDPFESRAGDDVNTVMQAFHASGGASE